MKGRSIVLRPDAEWGSFVMVLGGPKDLTKRNTYCSLLRYSIKCNQNIPMKGGNGTHDNYVGAARRMPVNEASRPMHRN